MNFFGHAWVASRTHGDAAFVLGAMLPDFASMARVRLAAPRHAGLQAGLELHHRTDSVFHRLPGFLRLNRWAVAELRARGLSRGMARGSAHVAIELLLDGTLVLDPGAARAYGHALEAAFDPAVDGAIGWPADARPRWQTIRTRLRRSGAPLAYRDPAQVSARVAHALRERPALALDSRAERSVAQWVAHARPVVVSGASRLLAELELGLATRAAS